MNEQIVRQQIIEIGKLLYNRGLVASSDGNISYRLDENRIIATPTQVSKGRMTEDMMAITDLNGKPLNDKRASSELQMHLLIYRERPDIKAVVHAHPPHGTAFAVAGLSIDAPILSEVILTLGCVPLTAYGTPSTTELTEQMQPFVKNHNALLMANHGAVAYGDNLWQAFDRMETLEHTAKITILSRALGEAQRLSNENIEKLVNIREKAGYLDKTARCQSCGYLSETNITCDAESHDSMSHSKHLNGNGKIELTRDELIELLAQAASV
ncbi:MAG: class II aldolase/adducin family protein [Pyrinomonadaceae bacterium]|nr:class II aldolase/adducin family protein [Pyrinomonadaceae bacterium]